MRGFEPFARPRTLPSGGYQWWYLDARDPASGDGLVAILYVGSVFSPWYAEAIRRGRAPRPEEHAAVHVSLRHGGRTAAFVMRETGSGALTLAGDGIGIGANSLRREPDGAYVVTVDDRHVPYFATSAGGPVRGRIRLFPEAPPYAPAVPLAAGAPGHRWGVVAPRGRVEADFTAPRFALRCEGYHDTIDGNEPLERALRRWAWARLSGRGEVRLAYQVQDRAGEWSCRRVWIDDRGAREEEGRVASFDGAGLWGVRWPRTLDGAGAVGPAWEDSPFYVRWPVADGGLAGVAEVVDLERFSHPLVRRMLRYRTRRR